MGGFLEQAQDSQIQLEDPDNRQIGGFIEQPQDNQIQLEDQEKCRFGGFIEQSQQGPIHLEDQDDSLFGGFIEQGHQIPNSEINLQDQETSPQTATNRMDESERKNNKLITENKQ